ncbi:MAG: zinc ribbon domain-containing protein [Thiothrix sp.]|uniref:zinc ribbon domain-containing protein n=1 Tax=Thiothrix sp. TaxID=1032 RepID=UPI002603B2D0|nr:zinc ribbon domain-containing protein [Thiothrix sp.]MDD5392246.1 zinc ribbon domain-containing protein [Thiothrix sp.]
MNEQTALVQHRLDAAQAADLLGGGIKGKLAPAIAPSAVAAKHAALPDGLDKAGLAFLADPQVRIGVTLASPGNVRNLVAYGAGDSERLVGFTAGGDGSFNLATALSPEHLAALVITGLGLDQDINELHLSAPLSRVGLLALVGFADALRQRDLETLLARLPKPESRVSLEEIYLRTLDGMVSGDVRWSTALVAQLVDGLPDVGEAVLLQGMQELQQASWVQTVGNNWQPTGSFTVGCAHWQLPLAGASVQLARLMEGEVEVTDFTLFRLLGSVWLWRREGAQHELASISSTRAMAFLDGVLAGFTVLPKPTAPPKAQETPPARPRPRFCRQCGKPLLADARFCAACGTPI